jgi:hypothetical protein
MRSASTYAAGVCPTSPRKARAHERSLTECALGERRDGESLFEVAGDPCLEFA